VPVALPRKSNSGSLNSGRSRFKVQRGMAEPMGKANLGQTHRQLDAPFEHEILGGIA
jgi:hypothetical protein